jgi:L-fuconolactonase
LIDGYCHCGTSKYLPVEDVRVALERAGVERAVLCQHLGEFDNRYLASVLRRHQGQFQLVGLVDADAANRRESIRALAREGFAGLRIPRETMLERLDTCREAIAEGLILVLDTSQGIAECLPAVSALVESGTNGLVIAHLGYPTMEAGQVVDGGRLLELSGAPDTYVLLSGQSMWCPAPYEALYGFAAEVIEAFGTDRVIWGSNYPVCGHVDSFRSDLGLITGGEWGLHPEQVLEITHDNAERLWFGERPGGRQPSSTAVL